MSGVVTLCNHTEKPTLDRSAKISQTSSVIAAVSPGKTGGKEQRAQPGARGLVMKVPCPVQSRGGRCGGGPLARHTPAMLPLWHQVVAEAQCRLSGFMHFRNSRTLKKTV